MRLAFLILLSCSGQDPVPSKPSPKPIVKTFKAATPTEESSVGSTASGSVGVSLAFANISSIHRGFFVQSKAVSNLGVNLAECLKSDATVEIGYTAKTLTGRIALVSNGDFGSCAPNWTDDAVDLKPWIPLGQALAKYRDYVAGTSDFRISNFEVGIRVERENGSCFWPIKGQHPPDGSLWSRCPEIDGIPVCTNTSQPTALVSLSEISNPAGLRSCFSP